MNALKLFQCFSFSITSRRIVAGIVLCSTVTVLGLIGVYLRRAVAFSRLARFERAKVVRITDRNGRLTSAIELGPLRTETGATERERLRPCDVLSKMDISNYYWQNYYWQNSGQFTQEPIPQCFVNLSVFANELRDLQSSGRRLSIADARIISQCHELRALNLSNSSFDGGGLKEILNACGKLEELDLNSATGMDDLSSWHGTLPNIRVLVLAFSDCPPQLFTRIADMHRLTDVSLAGTKIDHNGLLCVLRSNRAGLQTLNVAHTDFDDECLKSLLACISLAWVNLNGTAINDNGIASLRECTSVRSVWLSGTHLTDRAMADLAAMANLEELMLPSGITDAGLRQLQAAKKLRSLFLSGDAITMDAIDQMEKALPGIHIHANREKAN